LFPEKWRVAQTLPVPIDRHLETLLQVAMRKRALRNCLPSAQPGRVTGLLGAPRRNCDKPRAEDCAHGLSKSLREDPRAPVTRPREVFGNRFRKAGLRVAELFSKRRARPRHCVTGP
jgi:hypothetical protein